MSSQTAATARPGLCRGVRLVRDPVRDQAALLYPEGVLLVNETAAAMLALCDGTRTVAAVTGALMESHPDARAQDVAALLADLAARRLLRLDGLGHGVDRVTVAGSSGPAREPRPVGLLALLTYRCTPDCPYCPDRPHRADGDRELSTSDWTRVLAEARELGVLQVHFAGGEPLLRGDLADLVRQTARMGMYTNLVTSGVGLDRARLAELLDAGLDHVQLSIRDRDGRTHHRGLATTAALVRATGLPLTLDAVLPDPGADRVATVAALAARLGADRVAIAHTQFYGWAWLNRAALMPTAGQVREADRAAAVAAARYGDRMEVAHIVADEHTGTPKACMDGWGNRQLVVAPDGDVLPCLSARVLPEFAAPNVRDVPLARIWYDSAAFNRFRGTDWLPDPCHSCARREIDFGGCRCQAYLLTGDAAATDPACVFSPLHHLMTAAPPPAGARAATPAPAPRSR